MQFDLLFKRCATHQPCYVYVQSSLAISYDNIIPLKTTRQNIYNKSAFESVDCTEHQNWEIYRNIEKILLTALPVVDVGLKIQHKLQTVRCTNFSSWRWASLNENQIEMSQSLADFLFFFCFVFLEAQWLYIMLCS